MNHSFDIMRPVSSCAKCGIVRMWRSTGVVFARTFDGPWGRDEPECVSIPPEEPWVDRPIVMMDVETTGLDWTCDEITEIAFCAGRLYRDGEHYVVSIGNTFHSLVQPRNLRAAERTAEITGISVDMLRTAPHFCSFASEIDAFLESHDNAVLAAYNGKFDQPFVAAAFLREGFAVPKMLGAHAPLLDPYSWVRKLDKYVPGKGRHKLTATAIRHGVIDEEIAAGAHRADFDAEVALRLLATLAPLVPEDLVDLLDYQRAADDEWSKGFFADYLPKCRKFERLKRMQEG